MSYRDMVHFFCYCFALVNIGKVICGQGTVRNYVESLVVHFADIHGTVTIYTLDIYDMHTALPDGAAWRIR